MYDSRMEGGLPKARLCGEALEKLDVRGVAATNVEMFC